MTFAVIGDASVELVSMEAGAPDLILPESVSYESTDYALAAIAPYAFYLSGATDVVLPVTITDVDDRAFRSSEVSSVEVAEGNETYSSFDGALYDAGMNRLLLIPGGRQGAVRIPSQASDVPASAFSHCALVTAIDADAGGAAYLSWEGSLYDASGTTLIRVPAGATEITIRDGCTSIAAGAMEGCASLERIDAPATVASISPYLFERQPETVMAPVAVAAVEGEGDPADGGEPGEPDSADAQLTALVALSSVDDGLPSADPTAITVSLLEGAASAAWEDAGFSLLDVPSEQASASQTGADVAVSPDELPIASVQSAATSRAYAALTYRANAAFSYSPYTSSSTPVSTLQKTVPEGGSYTYGYDEQVRWNGYCIEAWARQTSQGVTPSPIPYWYLGIGAPNTGVKYATLNGEPMVQNRWYMIPSDGQGVLWMYDQTSPATVTWNANGGSVSPTTSSVQLGKTVNAPFPTRSGQTFLGWYTAATGGTKVCGSAASGGTTAEIRKNVTYYAHWGPIPMADYSVTVRGNNSFYYGGWRQASGTGSVTTVYQYTPTYVRWVQSGTQSYLQMYHDDYWWFNIGFGDLQSGIKYATIDGAAMTPNAWYQTTKEREVWIYDCASPTTVTWNANGGSVNPSSSSVKLGTTATAPLPTRSGYSFKGWYTATSGGSYVCGGSTSGGTTGAIRKPVTYHALWDLIEYRISYQLDGGTVSGNPVTYDVTTSSFTLKNPTKQGYVFAGWSGTGLTGDANTTVTVLRGSTGNRSYTAHWRPALSADIPLDVTAKVDLLGVEEQEEATGYIESRCGEPLTVVSIELSPLSGASELFGVANVADVSLEVRTDAAASPDATFALDAFASKAPATPAAFRMASYGSRVPISYRFDIPEALLPSLVETTKPVCSVAYTVALA